MSITTFVRSPTSGESSAAYTYEESKAGHRCRPKYTLVRQQDRRLVRIVAVHPKMKSNRRRVSITTRIFRWRSPNHRPKPRDGTAECASTGKCSHPADVGERLCRRPWLRSSRMPPPPPQSWRSTTWHRPSPTPYDRPPRILSHVARRNPHLKVSMSRRRLRIASKRRGRSWNVYGRNYAPAPKTQT